MLLAAPMPSLVWYAPYLLRGEDDDHAYEPHEEGERVEEPVGVEELRPVLDHLEVVRAEVRLLRVWCACRHGQRAG